MMPRITEQEIRDLVFAFYERVREDERLGPVFERSLEGRWPAHLEKMCDFWSSILLATGRFQGDPVRAHVEVAGIRPEHFDRWIELFGQTAAITLRPETATDIVGRAARIRVALEHAACSGLQGPEVPSGP
ncbi:MAG: group III truncated hemoglobin [Gemmatimonadota bacterium]|nr:group III truncated hemoglobin [Gemmatimonadota bacterium]